MENKPNITSIFLTSDYIRPDCDWQSFRLLEEFEAGEKNYIEIIFGLFSKNAAYQSQLIVFDIDLSGFCRSWNVL